MFFIELPNTCIHVIAFLIDRYLFTFAVHKYLAVVLLFITPNIDILFRYFINILIIQYLIICDAGTGPWIDLAGHIHLVPIPD